MDVGEIFFGSIIYIFCFADKKEHLYKYNCAKSTGRATFYSYDYYLGQKTVCYTNTDYKWPWPCCQGVKRFSNVIVSGTFCGRCDGNRTEGHSFSGTRIYDRTTTPLSTTTVKDESEPDRRWIW